MNVIHSFLIAFSMYSKLPVPQAEWNEENMKYVLCFFPLIGLVEGALMYGAFWLLTKIMAEQLLIAAVLTCIPIFITGGIHMDGFLDTTDALASCAPMEKKLAILKDSHTGAFAIIGCIVWFVLYFGAIASVNTLEQWILVGIGFVLSRCLSGLAIVYWKGARKDGMMYTFSSTAHKTVVRISLISMTLLCAVLLITAGGLTGLLLLAAALVLLLYYRHKSYQEFGGITGDLAGYFLQLAELLFLYVIVLA